MDKQHQLRADNYLFQQCWAALMYDELEDYEDVIRLLTDHLQTNPQNAAAYHNRAVAYWEIGQSARALADFDEAVRLAPADSQPAKVRGMLLHKLGNLPAALASFDLAVRIAPDDPYHRRARAHCRTEAGDLVGAVEDFNHAIAVQPNSAYQYLDRAALYERLGQKSLAGQDRATASRLRPRPNQSP
jgi:tetratricopeptide (TPR) repeat protein